VFSCVISFIKLLCVRYTLHIYSSLCK
jgi:hypothetical protein